MLRGLGSTIGCLSLLIVLMAAPAMADLESGLEAYDRGDMKTAYQAFLAAAEKGDAEAQYYLGTMYLDGFGTKQNFAEAAAWFRKAAEQGDADAQFELSNMLYWGDGVPVDLKESAYWTRQAAEQGLAAAQLALGDMYYLGEGVPMDLEESARWTLMAAEQGDAEAQYQMALNHYYGEGVPEDLAEYVRWTELAANQGHFDAQFDMGEIYFYGDGVAVDLAEAERWYQIAADQGHPDAQARLIEIIGKDGPVDPALIGQWELYAHIDQQWRRWMLDIAADGTYSFYDNGTFGHSGTFEAKDGNWQLVSQTNTWTDGGSYQMPHGDVFNMIGSLGPGSWHRVYQ